MTKIWVQTAYLILLTTCFAGLLAVVALTANPPRAYWAVCCDMHAVGPWGGAVVCRLDTIWCDFLFNQTRLPREFCTKDGFCDARCLAPVVY
jgi:hypothetical protein